jgi:hypothetical protein
MDRVLFFDDDHERNTNFRRRIAALGYPDKYEIIQVFSAEEAIDELGKGNVISAFLDHDLSDDDVLVEVGRPTKKLTGMAVVDFITAMEKPPSTVVVHSMNYDAAVEMTNRLAALRTIVVHRIPFSMLLTQLQAA